MELILEIIMGVLLDAAMFILVINLLKARDGEKKKYRLLSVTFAVGFVFGITSKKCFVGGNYAVIILFALGFMLAYTAFIFTFPEKRKRHEGR